MRCGGCGLFHRRNQAGFANARLPGQQYDAAFAGLRLLPASHQQRKLFRPVDERQLAPTQRLMAAVYPAFTQHHPCALGRAAAFQVRQGELAIIEQTADQEPRGVGNHHRAGFRRRLQAARKIGRVPRHDHLARRSETDEIAHDHEPAVDTDADAERSRWARHRIEPRDSVHDSQSRAHRSLRIGFIGPRISKVDQNAITHVTSDEPVETSHQTRDVSVKGGQRLPQRLGIKPLADGRRSDQVDDHDTQKPTLWHRYGRGRLWSIRHSTARSAAIAAEPFVGQILTATGAALPWQRRTAVSAKPVVDRNRSATARAHHTIALLLFGGLRTSCGCHSMARRLATPGICRPRRFYARSSLFIFNPACGKEVCYRIPQYACRECELDHMNRKRKAVARKPKIRTGGESRGDTPGGAQNNHWETESSGKIPANVKTTSVLRRVPLRGALRYVKAPGLEGDVCAFQMGSESSTILVETVMGRMQTLLPGDMFLGTPGHRESNIVLVGGVPDGGLVPGQAYWVLSESGVVGELITGKGIAKRFLGQV